jgi:Domain of unknown function (DUF4352)
LFVEKFKNRKQLRYIVSFGLIGIAVVGAYAIMGTKAISDTAGVYKLTISDVSIQPAQQDTKLKRATVKLSLHNVSNEVLQVSPGLQMLVTTDMGKVYNMTARYLDKDETIGGPLASNASVDMAIDFDIPKDEKPITFIYQLDNSVPKTEIGL